MANFIRMCCVICRGRDTSAACSCAHRIEATDVSLPIFLLLLFMLSAKVAFAYAVEVLLSFPVTEATLT
jgi:hypothetical protein